VPETLLIPLYGRALETGRPDAIVRDPKAVDLVGRPDADFARFGRGSVQHAIRARELDSIVRAFLGRHPAALVVNLGAGPDTAFDRVDDGRVRWDELDLPEVIALRPRLFAETARRRALARSALDPAWLDEVERRPRALVLAAGVLRYFPGAEVRRLVAALADRFPGGQLVFDTVPARLSRKTVRDAQKPPPPGGRYRWPAMPWGIDRPDGPRLAAWHPRIEVVRRLDPVVGYRRRLGLIGLLSLVPALNRRFGGSIVHLRFREA
jgi:O-methyltransferase involved in polyketide biosynthesis